MNHLLCVILLWPILGWAQVKAVKSSTTSNSSTTGIQWINGLTWKQVQQKAKQENKYIFLDCFATWCGPCRLMDQNVYTNDSVGNYFAKYFISVKVQMDKTKNDDSFIQSWYGDAVEIGKQYHIEAFPSFIFLSPDNVVLNKAMGYKSINDLIEIAHKAIAPGSVYKDPYAEYNRLIADYQNGIKNYDRMPDMIQIATKLGNQTLAKQLLEEHTDFVLKLSKEQRYTWKNIQLWASYDKLRIDGPRFRFFYEDGTIIDKVMRQKGYADAVVLKTIQHEVVDSFYRMQTGETTIITGKKVPVKEIMFMQLPIRMDGKIEPVYIEANWKMLWRMTRMKFGKQWADKTVLQARIQWYRQLNNLASYLKYTLKKYKKYPPNMAYRGIEVNQFAWNAFLYTSDRKLLKGALYWSEQTIKQKDPWALYMDTYANLLYKLGRIGEAIDWEEKAVAKDPNDRSIREALKQMKNGEHTYVNQGAIW